jgi:hypothetical protein
MEQLKKGPTGLFLCLYVNVHTSKFFVVVLFRKGPKFLLPLYICSHGTDKILISQTKRKPKLIPLYVGKVSCREFWHPFLRNRSRWCPDLVQIWSRFCGPDRLDQFLETTLIQTVRNTTSRPNLDQIWTPSGPVS